jgi:hypothetical protein
MLLGNSPILYCLRFLLVALLLVVIGLWMRGERNGFRKVLFQIEIMYLVMLISKARTGIHDRIYKVLCPSVSYSGFDTTMGFDEISARIATNF